MELGDIEILTTNNFSPNIMEDIRKRLLDALKSRDFQSFKQIVEENSNELPANEIVTYVNPNEKDTYLDIACRAGLKNFVEFLLDNGAEINRVNDEYDCAPIHFAVKGRYVDILEILLLPRKPSRDVTHREAEQRIDPNLEVEQRTALHIAVEENYEECAALLLEKDASANILNSKNRTALHVAAIKGYRNMVMLILDKCTERLKVDRYRDNKNQTTRQVIVKKWPEMENELLEKIPIEGENLEEQGVTVQDLKYHLNNTDETSFLKCMEVIQEEIPPHIAQTLLTISVQHNFQQAVTAILRKFEARPLNMRKAVCVSVQKAHYVILEKLLKARPELTNEELILKVCQEMGIPREREVDNTNLLKCLELMLERKNVNVRCSDEKGNTPLHYAARADNRKAMSLLLERGSYIGQKNRFNVAPIMNIPVCTLRDHFNDCLKMKDQMMKDQVTKEQMNKYVIEFDYSCLKPLENFAKQNARLETRETEVFLLISENKNLKHLLRHPLLSSFLYLKWLKIRHVLYANLVFYWIFYFLLNAYILCTTCYSENSPNENGTQTVNNCVDTGNTPLIQCCPEVFLWIFVIVLWSLFTVREIFQCACSPYRYVVDWENWLQVLLIIFILIFLCGAGLWSGVMVIILSALELITLIGQHPKMSASFEMFRTVSLTYMRLLFPYTFLIIAFALAFYVLFRGDNEKFPDIGHSLFKTSIMITGEFNSSEIPFGLYPVCSRIVFVLFVFLIAIVLFNLLNGLAVSDTSEIRSKGELIGLISRIRLIVYLEDIAFGKPFSWFGNSRFSQWNPFGFLINRILLFPYYLKDGKITIVYDNLDVHDDRYYVRSNSMSNNENSPIDLFNENLEMDPDIIEETNRIISDKNQLSDNDRLEKIMNDRFERIMNYLNKQQETLITIENTLKKLNLMT